MSKAMTLPCSTQLTGQPVKAKYVFDAIVRAGTVVRFSSTTALVV